jgi:alanyl-tRNA synthetase
MEKSKALARANWRGSGDKSVEERWFKIREELKPTEFLGYEFDKAEGVVLKLSKNNKFVDSATAGDKIDIITNQTPFYGESGGQVGDQGKIYTSDCEININDTQKKMGDLFVHSGDIKKGKIKVGQSVNLEIDIEKRNNSKANHSATHILHESLRRTLGKHVTQKGSLVSPDRLRFDFSHNKPIGKEEMTKINKVVNNIVEGSSDVQTRIMTPKEAVKMGALALFGEKYGQEVRVVFMGRENNGFFSTELCGGTHVKNTKEVGKFKVINQSSIASGVRRVEALRDQSLERYEKSQQQDKSLKEKNLKNELENLKKEFKIFKLKADLNNKLSLSENLKNLNKQLAKVKIENLKKNKNKNIIKDKKIGNITLREQVLKDFPPKELRTIIDEGKKEIKSGIIVSISIFEDKVGVAVGVSKDLTSKYDAVNLVKIGSEILGGKGGGGRKDFAQAGGVDKKKIEEVFKEIKKKIN